MNTIRIISLCLVVLLAVGCEQRIRPSVADDISTEDLPSQESWNSTIILSRDGKIKAVVSAGYIAVYSEKNITNLDHDVKVDFYNEDEHITSILTSMRAVVDDNTGNLSAYDSVVVISDDGRILETEELHWLNQDEKIITEAYVVITSEDEIIRGYGLESDADLSNYTIYRVTGQTRPERR